MLCVAASMRCPGPGGIAVKELFNVRTPWGAGECGGGAPIGEWFRRLCRAKRDTDSMLFADFAQVGVARTTAKRFRVVSISVIQSLASLSRKEQQSSRDCEGGDFQGGASTLFSAFLT